ncbi:MAG: hypothetical protein EFT35_05480 [Methanophagales archaeon ANME-1-THS]|nr:MAG: hypothetical protein EFT35_05480 [Methanophagales archaeon ANME-1-THS]
MKKMLPWIRKEWTARESNALGLYIALLLLQFRVRYSTDIPLLSTDDRVLEARLRPYLAIFLKDEELAEAVETGRVFFKAFVEHTSLPDYAAALDAIELDCYPMLREAYLRHVKRADIGSKIADYDARTLIERFLDDLDSNRFSKGKMTSAGSSILLMPFSELMDLYHLSEEQVRVFLRILRDSGIMFLDIIPAPVHDRELRERLL